MRQDEYTAADGGSQEHAGPWRAEKHALLGWAVVHRAGPWFVPTQHGRTKALFYNGTPHSDLRRQLCQAYADALNARDGGAS